MKNPEREERLKLVCPGEICFLEKEEARLSEVLMTTRSSKWLNLFCPQGRCEVNSPSQLA